MMQLKAWVARMHLPLLLRLSQRKLRTRNLWILPVRQRSRRIRSWWKVQPARRRNLSPSLTSRKSLSSGCVFRSYVSHHKKKIQGIRDVYCHLFLSPWVGFVLRAKYGCPLFFSFSVFNIIFICCFLQFLANQQFLVGLVGLKIKASNYHFFFTISFFCWWEYPGFLVKKVNLK